MEGQRNQEFAPVTHRDALNALNRIEKEIKRGRQSGHPISFVGSIAANPIILTYLYENHQGIALEHDGKRLIWSVEKDPEDPTRKRLTIQGLGFNRVRGRTIDIEWLKQYGEMGEKGDIEELAKLTHQDVVRSFRRAILERYDPYKYKNNSISGAVNLGINTIAEVSGVRAISGAISDTVADKIADRNYRIQTKKARETPSDRLRREKRKGIAKKVTLAVGGALAAASIVGSAGVYEHQHPGTAGRIIQSAAQTFHHEQKTDQPTPSQETSTPVTPTPMPESSAKEPARDIREKNVREAVLAVGAIAGIAGLGVVAEAGRRKIKRWLKKKRDEKYYAEQAKKKKR